MTQKKILLSPEEQLYLRAMEDLNKPRGDGVTFGLASRLHEDQINQLKPLFVDKKTDLFLSCARKWGKTELVCYVLWRWALENPGAACYYVAPESSHARELIWENNRLQNFLGPESKRYVERAKNQTMVLPFKNGSYIRCIGSENYMVANGLTPSIAVYDEFKGFNPRWHIEFAPNRAAKGAPLVIIGTKPRAGNKNMDQYNDVLAYMGSDKENSYIAERTTFDNPLNQMPEKKKMIEAEIRQLRARGEEDVVQLEYFSKVVPGGKKAIFPMFRSSEHVYPHFELMHDIEKDRNRLLWAWVADPGNTTCFAMLYAAYNEYTGDLYLLDEIYEKDQNNTSVGIIVPKGKLKALELYPKSSLEDDWLKACDDQAQWFMTECLARFGIYFSPAEKWKGTKEEGISLIKDQLIYGAVKISDRCENLIKEVEKYAKDGSGKIPKKDDHLIDSWRYLNLLLNYDFKTIQDRADRQDLGLAEGRFRLEDRESNLEDWTDVLGDDIDLDI